MKKPAARRPPAPRNQPQQQQPQQQTSVTVERREAWIGPLPPPAVLDQFNGVVEHGAERIFAAWENETKHRQALERSDLHWAIFEGIFGKVLAFLFVMATLGLAAYCAAIGAVWLSGLFGAGVIVAVVWAFIKSNRKV